MARIREAVVSTHTAAVLDSRGGFAGLYTPSVGDPLLAAGCDGVGTKVLLGAAAGRLRGLGIDLVAMSVNDVLTAGGRPAFFMDVITCGRIVPDRIAELVEGVAEGCRTAGCALLGGETAEHPDMMAPDEFDLAGFCVAVSERRELISGARVEAGDVILALPSSGPHSNGFSLIRRLLERVGLAPDATPEGLGGASVADALLEPTAIYAAAAGELPAHGGRPRHGPHHGRRDPGEPDPPVPRRAGGEDRPEHLDAAAGLRLAGLAGRRGGRDAACLQPGHRIRRGRGTGRRRRRPAGGGAGRLPGLGVRRGDHRRRGGAALRTGVLISGEGTNLQALIDADGVDVACVVSSRPGAPGVERAARAGLRVTVTADADETADFLDRHDVELVALAGYMRILPARFLERFPGRVVNVHPSLLPAFPGRTAIADALAHGVRVTGVTVHLVDEGVDTGPIILQEAVEVPYDVDALELERRIHLVEHRLLVRAVREFPVRAAR